MALRSRQEFYDLFRAGVEGSSPTLTDFNEGSILDILGGVVSTAASEVSQLTLESFAKHYFKLATGADLQTLAVDHFGANFSRPAAATAVGIVTFTRPNAAAGNVQILAGTIVKTSQNANGESQRFETLSDVTLTGTSINASIEAVEAGTKGNVDIATISTIETTLTDPSITVSNAAACSGGAEELDDDAYREHIYNLIEQLQGATLAAIESRADTVPGIEHVKGIETAQTVIEYDVAGSSTIGASFTIPRAKLYVADANGTANPALVALVVAAIREVRAAGVRVDVIAATALALDWTVGITLNPSGPNFATLSTDKTAIEDSMKAYVDALEIGEDFNRSIAEAAMLAVWGPTGSSDITAIETTTPTGSVSASETQKLIPGTVEVA